MKNLIARFQDDVTVLSHDNYYRPYDELTIEERRKLNYDHPDAFDTDMMIGEVAAASGFDNCCSFARAFRARFGVSASGYREAAINLPPKTAKSAIGSGKPIASVRT